MTASLIDSTVSVTSLFKYIKFQSQVHFQTVCLWYTKPIAFSMNDVKAGAEFLEYENVYIYILFRNNFWFVPHIKLLYCLKRLEVKCMGHMACFYLAFIFIFILSYLPHLSHHRLLFPTFFQFGLLINSSDKMFSCWPVLRTKALQCSMKNDTSTCSTSTSTTMNYG